MYELGQQHSDKLDVEQKVLQPDRLIGAMHTRTIVSDPAPLTTATCSADRVPPSDLSQACVVTRGAMP